MDVKDVKPFKKPFKPHSKSKMPPLMLPQNIRTFNKYNKHRYYIQPLPLVYKRSAKALLEAERNHIPLKDTLSPSSSVNQKAYNLASLALQRREEINCLLKKTDILKKDWIVNQWLAKILIAELIWKGAHAKSNAKEVEAIKFYEEEIKDAFVEVINKIRNPIDQDKCLLPMYVRINTLAISIEDCLRAFQKEGWNLLNRCNSYADHLNIVLNLEGNNFTRDFHVSELLVFPPGTLFYDHPGYIKGKFLIQDKGSCLSSFLLNPKPNSVVLDVFAAPGLKTNHLANIMGNTGLIYANDIHPRRLAALNTLLKTTFVTCTETIKEDYADLNLNALQDVRYILVDPSCTMSGIFYGITKLKKSQRNNTFTLSAMLRFCLQNFPNVKRVVYTTCSVYSEEGEEVVDSALKDIGDSFNLLDVKEMLWNEWDNMSLPDYHCSNKCLRIVPEADLCQGYFIAVFERNFDVPVPPYIRKLKKGGKIYNSEELTKIEKVNAHGKVIQAIVPKNRVEGFKERQLKALKRRIDRLKAQNQNGNQSSKRIRRLQKQLQIIESQYTSNSDINLHNSHSTIQQTSSEAIESQLYP